MEHPLAPGVLAHEELIVELHLASFQRLEHDGQQHELAHAGGVHELLAVALKHDVACLGIHENRLRRLDGDVAGRLRLCTHLLRRAGNRHEGNRCGNGAAHKPPQQTGLD